MFCDSCPPRAFRVCHICAVVFCNRQISTSTSTHTHTLVQTNVCKTVIHTRMRKFRVLFANNWLISISALGAFCHSMRAPRYACRVFYAASSLPRMIQHRVKRVVWMAPSVSNLSSRNAKAIGKIRKIVRGRAQSRLRRRSRIRQHQMASDDGVVNL